MNKRLIIILFCVITGNLSCNRAIPFDAIRSRPDMRIKNFVSRNYQEGMLLWELKAEDASYFFSENRSIARKVAVNYFKDKKITAKVNSDSAVINTETKNIELKGNVDVVSPSGNRLITSRIFWNNQEKFFDTDEPVEIFRKNGDIIRGKGLRANYNLDDYEIKRDVLAVTTRHEKKGEKKKQKKH